MVSNGLKLNQDKTELLPISSRHRQYPVLRYLQVGNEKTFPSESIRNLGVYFDQHARCCICMWKMSFLKENCSYWLPFYVSFTGYEIKMESFLKYSCYPTKSEQFTLAPAKAVCSTMEFLSNLIGQWMSKPSKLLAENHGCIVCLFLTLWTLIQRNFPLMRGEKNHHRSWNICQTNIQSNSVLYRNNQKPSSFLHFIISTL